MAGLHQLLKPNSQFSSSSSSSSSSSHIKFSSSSQHLLLYKILLLLCLLPLSLALFAFFLQWPLDNNNLQFPGSNNPIRVNPSSTNKCATSTNALVQKFSPVFPYFRAWNFDYNDSKICITSSTSAGLEQILPWIFYHKVIGFSKFFVFVEGKAATPKVSNVLKTIPGVQVVNRTKELEEQQAKSRIWNETWLSNFFYKPCIYNLFVKQCLNMEMAIVLARDAGMEWIFHLDTDELLYPAGTRDYSVQDLLAGVPSDIDMVVFPNHESTIERHDIQQPFSEVSMFKRNLDHVPEDTDFGLYQEAFRGNPHYFMSYENGKAAARIQDHLRPDGAHRWSNYMKAPKEMKMEEAAVLHYTYSKYSDLTLRRDRCGCKYMEDDLERCFMLDFDRIAFVIASTSTQEEMLQWFKEHIVWDDEALKHKLLKSGIFLRIYAPMVIIKGLRESEGVASLIASAESADLKNGHESKSTTTS